jgi:hypothetical protein
MGKTILPIRAMFLIMPTREVTFIVAGSVPTFPFPYLNDFKYLDRYLFGFMTRRAVHNEPIK